MDIDTWFILNGYMVKWVITLKYPTYIHTYTDNPYPPQTIWVWIWVRATINQWHHDTQIEDRFVKKNLTPNCTILLPPRIRCPSFAVVLELCRRQVLEFRWCGCV